MWLAIRRGAGAFLMCVGGAVILAMAVVAGVVIANYVEWENAPDALGTVAMIGAPVVGGGAVVALLGRLVYGGWMTHAPVMHASSWLVRIAGLLTAVTLGGLLVLLLLSGVGVEDRDTAVALSVGLIGALMTTGLGFWIRPRHA